MSDKREFKGIWIPKHIWLNKSLNITEMFLLAEIESYDNDFGCVATNRTLCEDLRITPSTASSVIKSLEQKGFISVTYRNIHTHEGRKITVNLHPFGIPKPPLEKSEPPLEKSEPSNIFSNTSSSLYIKAELKNSAGKPKSNTVNTKKTKEKKHVKILNFGADDCLRIYGDVKQHFLDFYLQEGKTEYYFEPKDAAKIHAIIKKIIFKMKEKQHREDFIPDEIIEATNFFIKASYAISDNFLKSNFNLSNIDSKFNDSYTKLTTGNTGSLKFTSNRTTSKYRPDPLSTATGS